MKKTIAVTGGAGFIGSHLAKILLAEGHKVLVVDNLSTGSIENLHSGAVFYNESIENMKSKVLEGVDVVFHLASISGEAISFHSPEICFMRNIQAGYNLIKCCIEAKVKRVVFTSSMAIYGNRQSAPFSENMACNPTDPYGVSKQSIEYLIQCYGNLGLFEWNILRLNSVYGANMNLNDPYRGVIGIFISQVLQKKPISIYGDGTQTRAFTFVSDIIPNLAKTGLEEHINGEILNLGSGKPISLLTVAKTIFRILGEPENISFYLKRLGEAKDAFTTSQRAKDILGDFIETDFEIGLKSTLEWAKKVKKPLFNSDLVNLDLDLGQSPIPWLKK